MQQGRQQRDPTQRPQVWGGTTGHMRKIETMVLLSSLSWSLGGAAVSIDSPLAGRGHLPSYSWSSTVPWACVTVGSPWNVGACGLRRARTLS